VTAGDGSARWVPFDDWTLGSELGWPKGYDAQLSAESVEINPYNDPLRRPLRHPNGAVNSDWNWAPKHREWYGDPGPPK
jgi:hypothetical protein